MRGSAVLAAAVLALFAAGCDDDDSSTGNPSEVDVEVAAELEAGKDVYAQSGCGACHRLGDNGNDGPGPELTEIGNRLPREAIARALEVGPGIMPSYSQLEPKKKDDLTAFLAALN